MMIRCGCGWLIPTINTISAIRASLRSRNKLTRYEHIVYLLMQVGY